MKQLTVNIPENKFTFIVELLSQLGVKDIHENEFLYLNGRKKL